MTPTISIIMPCYNAATHLPQSVGSVLTQTFNDWELIAVDDGSSDDTLAWLQTHTDPRLRIHTQTNQGVSAARNTGLRLARGRYIAFLDADDTWAPTFLEKLYRALQLDADAVLSYCGWQNIGLSGGQGNAYIPPDYEKENKIATMLNSCPWPIHAALTSATIIKSAGGFSHRFTNAEDYALWLNIASHHKITLVAEVLAFYHHHTGSQASKNRVKAAYDTWRVKREFIDQWPDIVKPLGAQRINALTHGELLKRAYTCYWDRDMEAARQIFRMVMKTGYGSIKDWKYMLPSLLPLRWHNYLIKIFG